MWSYETTTIFGAHDQVVWFLSNEVAKLLLLEDFCCTFILVARLNGLSGDI